MIDLFYIRTTHCMFGDYAPKPMRKGVAPSPHKGFSTLDPGQEKYFLTFFFKLSHNGISLKKVQFHHSTTYYFLDEPASKWGNIHPSSSIQKKQKAGVLKTLKATFPLNTITAS